MKDLVGNVLDWSEKKGIHKKSTALSQRLYAVGELTNEFRDAIAKNKSDKEIKTELGDVIVYYINYLKMESDYDIHGLLSCPPHNKFSVTIDEIIDYAVTQSSYPFLFLEAIKNIAHCVGSTLEECLQLAYDKISKRDGKMQNGKMVKEEDL